MDVALRRLADMHDPDGESALMIEDFAEFAAAREKTDAGIAHWAGKIDDA